MEITTRDYKRVSVVRVVGRIDANSVALFEEKLKEYVETDHLHLVFEADATTYLNSSGVRVLISAQKALKPRGGRLVISQPSERVKEVLQIAGLESVIPVYETTEAAVGAF
jgi:anti-sigma B factor antagonist